MDDYQEAADVGRLAALRELDLREHLREPLWIAARYYAWLAETRMAEIEAFVQAYRAALRERLDHSTIPPLDLRPSLRRSGWGS